MGSSGGCGLEVIDSLPGAAASRAPYLSGYCLRFALLISNPGGSGVEDECPKNSNLVTLECQQCENTGSDMYSTHVIDNAHEFFFHRRRFQMSVFH